jgi:hypothetical protein
MRLQPERALNIMKMSTPLNARASRHQDAEEVLQSLLASQGWGATRRERTAGIVVPPSPRRSTQTPRVDLDMVAGRLAHRAVQGVLRQCPNPTFEDVGELLPSVLSRVLERESGLGSQKRRTSIRAEGAAMLYLTRFAPVPSCEFVGAEAPVEGGQVDLVWRHADGGVFFDELKTNRVRVDAQPNGMFAEQSSRYACAGRSLFGDAFAGVRIVPVLYPSRALFVAEVRGAVRVRPLAESPLAIDALRVTPVGGDRR